MDKDLKKVRDALFKKAIGYSYNEIIEEYTVEEEGGERLTKRKKTTKNVPPDIPATKLLLELLKDETNDYLNYSDQVLNNEIKKLKLLLSKMEIDKDEDN
ncbi:MAG: hypothetical protein J6J33_02700 [Clostridia bacterium]|nr:hypothetical protein [Clostridia bacterium]